MTPEQAPPSTNYSITSSEGHLSLVRFNIRPPPCGVFSGIRTLTHQESYFERALLSSTKIQERQLLSIQGHIGSETTLASPYSATQGLLATNLIILNHDQVMRTTSKLATPSSNYHTRPIGRLRSTTNLTRIRPTTLWVFRGTRLELRTSQPRVRYFGH
ncbi:hypothetical protein TNCV_1894191 [Trichonephila clavipes]|nr:hypothetical protein TNCV_1894191 [Trichonephila clavipes]